VLAHESGLGDLVDPLGGSYAVETLTKEIEANAEAYIATIDDLGGMVAAIEQGYVQREIQAASYRYQLDIENSRRLIVGQNAFAGDAASVPVLKVDPALERQQIDRLKAWRSARGERACEEQLRGLRSAADGGDNLMPLIIAAVRVGATVGEISDAFRSSWGHYEENVTV
jgi:methylmalonyl-CoA mutase N-terminal domain/subunit